MKKITQQEFDNLPLDEFGFKRCPSGDYSGIKTFGEKCIFGPGSIFGDWCSFDELCIFGIGCRFGDWCSFDAGCIFGERCRFDAGCIFGERCSFGAWCIFGERCRFGEECSFEGLTNAKFFACDRIGSENRKTYFYKSDEGYFVRAGCFFGTFAEFIDRVNVVHAGTVHQQAYLAAVDLARIVLG